MLSDYIDKWTIILDKSKNGDYDNKLPTRHTDQKPNL